MLKRLLQIDVPRGQSFFLWGPRQTGKSSFLHQAFPDAIYIDLLDQRLQLKYLEAPYLMEEYLLAQPDIISKKLPIIIDEIQKVPALLDIVHRLIESHRMQFILCGSSARKLKTQATNLLGGRAWIFHFYPLVFLEIPEFDLLGALQRGLLPTMYLQPSKYIAKALEGYIDIYLVDEIRNEGLVRNLGGFSHFLSVAGLMNGEMINMVNVARDCQVSRYTVQNYFQILVDTMLGYYVYPYRKKVKRDLISSMPKFYLFDVGVANYLANRQVLALKGEVAGRSFEHYILMELMAYKHLCQKRFDIFYWRTKTGLEVDFVLGQAECGIEIKIGTQVHKSELTGLIAFLDEHPEAKGIVVSQDDAPRKLMLDDTKEIMIYPWRVFLEKLWRQEFI